MALYTLQVPDPGPGEDWETTVPGQYLWGVKGITATLTTDPHLVVVDASGFGNDGTYPQPVRQSVPPPFGQVGAIEGDAALKYQAGSVAVFAQQWAGPSLLGMDWSADFSLEFWLLASGSMGDFLVVHLPGPTSVSVRRATASPQQMDLEINLGPFNAPADALLADGQWHYYCWTYHPGSPPTVKFYRDGALHGPVTSVATPGPLPAVNTDIEGIFPYSAPFPVGVDELAIYNQALGAGQVAAHYAARADFSTYFPAVLADAPRLYYHFDETGGVGGRQVCLTVTDGTRAVETIPTGLPELATGTTFQYSWQPSLQSRSESEGAGLISVPTGSLILPAGYTVGTETLDLGPDDQWSNIIIWWDSALQDVQFPGNPFSYPPGAHLVYHRRSGAE